MSEKKAGKEAKLCLDVKTGINQCILYIGAAGCFCFAFVGFAMNFSMPNVHAVVFGVVALILGVLMLVASRQR